MINTLARSHPSVRSCSENAHPKSLDSISEKMESLRRKGGRKSCLVNPLLFRIYSKSSFNRCVCLGYTLNPPLHNPIHGLGFSSTNKYGNGSPPHIGREAVTAAWLNLFQMASIDHIIYTLSVRFPWQRWPRFCARLRGAPPVL